MKKKILLSQRENFYSDRNEWVDSLSQEWTFFIEQCGYLPLPVPNLIKNPEDLFDDSVAGFVLTGGGDIRGDQVHRDRVEKVLLELAIQQNVPTMAVCRGAQFVADFFGWKLVSVTGHVKTRHQLFGNPELEINLADSLRGIVDVNSYHNFGLPIAKIPSELNWLLADSEMNAEAFSVCGRSILALMWHPERELPIRSCERELFSNLLQRRFL